MSFKVQRVSTVPNSVLRILVDAEPARREDGEAGLAQGGSFQFSPAGEDGDTVDGVSEYVARVLVREHPGHFVTTPELPAVEPPATTAVQDDASGGRKRKRAAKGGATS